MITYRKKEDNYKTTLLHIVQEGAELSKVNILTQYKREGFQLTLGVPMPNAQLAKMLPCGSQEFDDAWSFAIRQLTLIKS